jgi:HAE1 family hydrophobic/amphiphilic exporter-1/multidrug efflux pump
MFSRFFIDRPVFALVISIFVTLAGVAAMRNLPIAQYPEIAPPVVQVTAIYPGASAEVLEQTVAAPLENAITGRGLLYLASTSSGNGLLTITVTEIGTTSISRIQRQQPVKQAAAAAEVRRQGVTVFKI